VTGSRIWLAVAAIVLVPLVAYPVVVLARGGPSFPGDRGECARAAADDGQPVEVVAGHLAAYDEAEALRGRVATAGLGSAKAEQDGCGRWKVAAAVGSYGAGRDAVQQLARAGVRARLEVAPPA
jgi:hypothetical protein